MSTLTDQVPDNPPTLTITDEIWREIMDFTPVPVPGNPQFEAPFSNSQPTDLFAVKSNRCTAPAYRFIRKTNDSQMLMFVDGACLNNGQPNARAGWAVCVGPNIVIKGRLEPGVGSTAGQTNNRAELRSAIVALGLHFWKGEGFNSVVIASDSEYVVKGYCEGLEVWKQSNWMTARGTGVVNRDLWEALDRKIHELTKRGVQVLFWRIPREWNEADKYAKQAATQELDPDTTTSPTSPIMMLAY